MISVKNIYKSYEGLEVLKGASLEIKEGEISARKKLRVSVK